MAKPSTGRCEISPDHVTGSSEGPAGFNRHGWPASLGNHAHNLRQSARGSRGGPLRDHGWEAGHVFGRQEGVNALGDLGLLGRDKL
jgi:hypothetical protein